jgi:regulator of nonsense transcripts 2
MQEYIRKLLYHDLMKTNVDKVLRQIRKLNWDDSEISSFAIKCLIGIWNVKFYNVRCVANLLAGLNAFQDWIASQVVDGVLEDIRLGMEINIPKFNQRRVSMVRFLGELYNYRLVDSSVVFKVLYSFVTYGVIYDYSVYSEIDPPENIIRIRLICQLLETCGQYFSSGLAKKKLDCFLHFFQVFVH